MKSIFGLAAIAISTIQIVTIQTIVVAKPISNLNQIATEVSVQVISPDSDYIKDRVGAIVKKDRDLYSVLLDTETYAEAKYITTFDGRKYPIVAIETYNRSSERSNNLNADVYSIVKFRSPKNYLFVTLGDAKILGKNDKIYVSGHQSGKLFVRSSQLILNNSGRLFYNDREYTRQDSYGLIFNDRGELIGFHNANKWSIDDERLWPDYDDYPYPTLESLKQLYRTSFSTPDVCGNYWQGIRRRAIAIGSRYNSGETIDYTNLRSEKLGLTVNVRSNRQHQSTQSEADLAAAFDLQRNGSDWIAVIDRAILTNPINADLYGLRGNVRLNLRQKYSDAKNYSVDNQKMLADYDRAISLNPQDRLSLFLRSKLKTENEDYRGALADLDRLEVLIPNSLAVYYYRSYLKQHYLKDFPGALSDYNRLAELNPNDARVYLSRGLLQEQDIHNFSAALADYNRLLEIVKTTKSADYESESEIERTAPIYYFIARFKVEKMRDYRGALADYDRAISIEGKDSYINPDIYHDRAKVRAILNDFKGALADYNLSRRDDKSSDSYLLRAKFKLKYLNDRSGAFADYNQAVKLDRGNVEAYYERGMFLAKYRKDRAAAKADFMKARQLFDRLRNNKSEHNLALLKKIESALRN
jgi:Flp pilus assembly protein TadD